MDEYQQDNYSNQNNQPYYQPNQTPVPPPVIKQEYSAIARKIEKISAWVLISSAVIFAIISILSIWGVFSNSSGIVWKSLSSMSVLAFMSLVINVAARIFDGKK